MTEELWLIHVTEILASQVSVLCLVLRPLISAILRGLGSSEHRRDR